MANEAHCSIMVNSFTFFSLQTRLTGFYVSRYLISQHPEVEAKIMQELDSVGLLVTEERPTPRDLEYADIGKLPYLAAVMKVFVLLPPHHTQNNL
jgi:hypothetical protein